MSKRTGIIFFLIGVILLASPFYLNMCYGMCWYDWLPVFGFGMLILVFLGIASKQEASA